MSGVILLKNQVEIARVRISGERRVGGTLLVPSFR
jgi:hypothetical protein